MMSGIRTPPQKVARASPRKLETGATERRSIGDRIDDWEAARAGTNPSPSIRNPIAATAKTPPPTTTGSHPPRQVKTKTIEARECIARAKLHLGKAGNLKREIKEEVLSALTKLFSLIKGFEADFRSLTSQEEQGHAPNVTEPETSKVAPEVAPQATHIEEHVKLLRENNTMMAELKTEMLRQKELLEKVTTTTYASVTANTVQGQSENTRETLHSVIVTSTDDQDTGDQVLEKIRGAVDAKEGWIEVRNVRKARDRKIIIGLSSMEERNKLTTKLKTAVGQLTVEEVKNRDPLLVLRGVLNMHKDAEILKALRNQNKDLFCNLDKAEDRMELKYRRRARNPHTCHAVISVSPTIWRKAIAKKIVQIDLQPVRIEDQTPLVQCTRCLGYGHSKRFCTDLADLCSHCGGPHIKADCPDVVTGIKPRCRNCNLAKYSNTEHNAFDSSCPIKKKWDALARSTVAYC